MKLIDLLFRSYSYELGSKEIANDLESFNNIEHMKRFEKKVGIKKHYKSDNLSPYGLAINALKSLDFDKDNIKGIIYLSQTDEIKIPSVSSLLQKQITDNRNVFCIDVSQGCSGFIYTYYLSNLLANNLQGDILVVQSECYQSYINSTDNDISLLFSDSSFCYIVSPNNLNVECDFSFWNKSDLDGQMICSNDRNYFGDYSNNQIKMNGAGIYNFALDNVHQEINKILSKNKIDSCDLSLFVPHQANKHLLQNICKKANIEQAKMLINIESYSNTVSNSIPLALLNSKKDFKTGDLVLCTGFGVGLSIGNMLIKIK